jgi:hypothetical protein
LPLTQPPITLIGAVMKGKVALLLFALRFLSASALATPQITISGQPLSQDVLLGRVIQFSAGVQASVPVTFQWLKDGTNISGANTASISISVNNPNQAGAYRLRVSSQSESVESDPATLVIHAAAPDWASLFWRPFPETPGMAFRGIAYGNGVTIAAGFRQLVASTDEITWTEVTPPFFDVLTRIRFLNGRFWVTANSGVLWSSTDGVNWSRVETGVSWPLADITFDRGIYVVAPGDPYGVPAIKSIVSSDGLTWTQSAASFPTGNYADRIAAGNGVFVAQLSFSGKVAVSTDALNWSVQIVASVGYLTDIIFFNGQFVVTSDYGVYTSPDGRSWQKRLSANAYDYTSAVTNESELFLLGAKVARSTDGTNFTITTATALYPGAAVFTGSSYFAVDTSSSSRISTSSNALNWSYLGAPFSRPHNPARLNFANGNFFIPGPGGVTYGDGSGDWSKRLNMAGVPPSADFSDVASNGEIYLAANTVADANSSPMWKAGTNLEFSPFNAPSNLTRLIYADGEFLGIGGGYFIYRSPDGTNWTGADPSNSQVYLHAINKANGKAIAAGDSGKIFLSENGGPWTDVTPPNTPIGGVINSAAYGEGRFVVVGNGALKYSTDGHNWTPCNNGVADELNDIAYGDGMFLAAGGNGTIGYSWDGINWQAATLHVPENLYAVAYGNNRWVVASTGTLLQTGPRPGLTPITLPIALNAAAARLTINATPSRILRIETSTDLTAWTLHERLLAPNQPFTRDFPISNSSQLYIRAIQE